MLNEGLSVSLTSATIALIDAKIPWSMMKPSEGPLKCSVENIQATLLLDLKDPDPDVFYIPDFVSKMVRTLI